MTIAGGLLLSMALTYQFNRDPAGKSEDAMKAAAKATYVQSGVDKEVDQIEKYLERKYVPQYVKDYGGWIAAIVKVSQEHEVSFSWSY